ncbi:MAG TPA: Lrp/AsnC family transcriptional regulator, partial [Desulfitobacterium dehalogenans]|nr:Lrp/AsnC family transcriptional regulator [Desulfitobacterium dehalogenans]
EVALFVAEKLAPLEHVTDTTTHFILRRYKENGVELLGEDDIPERLVISP